MAAAISDEHVDWEEYGDKFLLEHQIGQFNELFNDLPMHQVLNDCTDKYNQNKNAAQQMHLHGPVVLTPDMRASPATHERNKKTYCCIVNAKIKLGTTSNVKDVKDISFKLPLMVKSRICAQMMRQKYPEGHPERISYEADVGGYFVIKGNRYVVVSQNNAARNNLTVVKLCTMSKPIKLPAAFQHAKSESYTLKLAGPSSTMHWESIIVRQKQSTSFLNIQGQHKTKKYPIVALLNRHGITADDMKALMTQVMRREDGVGGGDGDGDGDGGGGDMMDVDGLDDGPPHIIHTSIDRIYDSQVVGDEAFQVDPLPHIETDEDKKATIMHALKRLLLVMHEHMPPDVADSLKHRRIIVTADLYRSLIERRFTEAMKGFAKKQATYRFESITDAIEKAIQSGEMLYMKGVTTMMDTTNLIAMLSNLCRISSQLTQSEGGSNIIKQRLIYADFAGRLCFIEVPTGEHAGLVRQKAIGARITSFTNAPMIKGAVSNWLHDALRNEDDDADNADVEDKDEDAMATVWLNGEIQSGIQVSSREADVRMIIRKFRDWRAHRNSVAFVWGASIEWVQVAKELHFRTDGGRLVRRLRNLATKRVEWIDAAEELMATRVALSTETAQDIQLDPADYQEVCEDLMLGISACIQPYINHSQGPRVVYQSSQVKQAAAPLLYGVRMNLFPDDNNYLAHAQAPLVHTYAAAGLSQGIKGAQRVGGINCNGQMALTAIVPSGGYNQEDSILIKRSACERGLFCTVSCSTYTGELEQDPEKIQRARVPLGGVPNPAAHLIQEDGLPLVGSSSKVASLVLIVCSDNHQSGVFRTGPVQSSTAAKITVDHVQRPIENCTSHASVSVHQLMYPSPGDKFVTKGQKATVGRLVNDEDMPYSANGMTPDILINAHSIPSRMTVGLLIEALYNKQIAIEGGDRLVMSAFSTGTPLPASFMGSVQGKDVLYDGRTGRQMEADIFLAPVYWSRLEHVASEKAIVRGPSGTVDLITKQPARGRKMVGGVTHSSMDNWCLVAYNAKHHLVEVNAVDRHQIRYNPITGCLDPASNCYKEGPYALQMLMHELMCLRILPKFI